MTTRRALALLLVALAAAVAFALHAVDSRLAPRSPEALVPTVWKTARETPMHQLHVGTKKIACRECHAGAKGETLELDPPNAVATEASCAKCHEKEKRLGHDRSAHAGGDLSAGPTCLGCHVFGANKAATRCIDCHDAKRRAPGAPELPHHATNDVACGACHTNHGEERTVLPNCEACHTTTSATHGAFTARPAETPAGDGAFDASSTDRLDAAALAYFREAGAPASLFVAGPHLEGEASSSLDPHTAPPGAVCTTCHAPHAGKEPAKATCEGCHVRPHGRAESRAPALEALAARAPRVAPRGPGVAGHEACLTCHEPHRARSADAKPCTTCHADHLAATKTPGHDACTGCHAPHAPGEALASCASTCHANVTVLASDHVAAHADCKSCHDPHDARATTPASPDAACARCHENTAHSIAHGKGLACTQCHAPHSPERPTRGPALCATCHAEKAAAVHARPGHTNCGGCHGAAHAPVDKPACESCHAEEHRTAPAGHATCTNCHDAHSGARSPAPCTSCHQDKTKALHATLPQGCATCHRPHGPSGIAKPAPCSSCHAQPSLQGLHAQSGHATCATCHSSHGPPRSDRATCTGTCHTDRRSHQPDATSCNGCHLFRQ